METDAAFGAGTRMNPALVDSVTGLEFAPVAHRVAGAWLVDAATVFRLRVKLEVAARGRGSCGSDAARSDHEWAVALHDVNGLVLERDFYFYSCWVLGFEGLHIRRAFAPRIGGGRRRAGRNTEADEGGGTEGNPAAVKKGGQFHSSAIDAPVGGWAQAPGDTMIHEISNNGKITEILIFYFTF